MQAETFAETAHQKPFRPFRVHLKDGQYYDVRYQGLTLVLRTYVVIGIPVPGQQDPYAEYTVRVQLTDIDRLEMLDGAAAASVAS
jgi:hypothetical protein